MHKNDDRQGFLGTALPAVLRETIVGVVGLGGGGSHVVQQLAHIGFDNLVVCDPDTIEASNIHRLVGGTREDILLCRPKTAIAERLIHAVHPSCRVTAIAERWQRQAHHLRRCDVLFGCIDTFAGRSELEALARRFLIPYIDIGMDVSVNGVVGARMYGQVFLSLPNGPCMRCVGLLRNVEAPLYGDAGGRPQVIWANGVLASTAVAMALQLLTGWSQLTPIPIYLSYDGNEGTVRPHPRLEYVRNRNCPHYLADAIGTPRGVVL